MQDKHDPSVSEPPSKSQRKRDMHARQDLGRRLTELGTDSLRKLPIEEPVLEAIAEFRRMRTHEAKRRQMQYIGKLMRGADYDAIAAALDILTGASRESVTLMHECERLRDRLIAEESALGPFLDEHPGADAQWLHGKLRLARQERESGKPPKHARELYRWLHEQLQAARHPQEDDGTALDADEA